MFPSTAGASLVIRPVIPGALVVPAEMTLEPSQPTASVTFQVTPLALGRLRSARLEVFQLNRKVESIPLRVIVTRQLLTWVLLVLAFLVPTLWLLITRDNKLTGEPRIRFATAEEREAAKAKPGAKGKGKGGGKKKAAEAPGPEEPKNEELLTIREAPKPGEVLVEKLNGPHGVLPLIPDVTSHVADGLGAGYQFLCDKTDETPQLPLYVGAVLLVLALLSCLLNLSRRGRAHGKPLPRVSQPAVLVEAV
jgi:hypothetical protein